MGGFKSSSYLIQRLVIVSNLLNQSMTDSTTTVTLSRMRTEGQ